MIVQLHISVINKAIYFKIYHNIRPEFLYMEIALILSIAELTKVDRLAIHETGSNNLISDFQKEGEAVLVKHELSIPALQDEVGSFTQKIVRATEETPITDYNPIKIVPTLEDRIVSAIILQRSLTKKRN